MRALLDTHVLIWWLLDRTRLSQSASDRIRKRDDDAFVSAASVWEIATKVRIGKLPGMAPHVKGLEALIANAGFKALPVELRHGLSAGRYEALHSDPFDRMLAAQAELEGLTLITIDPAFAAFPCTTLW